MKINTTMKNIFLTATILINCIAFSQTNLDSKSNSKSLSFGIKAGINVANFTDFKEPGYNTSPRTGFNVGGYLNYKFSEKIAIQPELIYSTQGSVTEGFASGINVKASYLLDYIAVPVMFKYYATKNFSLEFGPQFSFNISKKLKGESAGTTLTFDLDQFLIDNGLNAKVNTFDFGLNLGLGYQLNNGLNFNGRYTLGMIKVIDGADVVKSDGTEQNIKNSIISLGLGYTFL
jgi:hypothetical protein